ncbi:hypothetical protein IW140_004738 [Coemansia sp. RSA 1813]|nr:hypothetical protein IW140_004738 [Coemansia sp. RSA 1813]
MEGWVYVTGAMNMRTSTFQARCQPSRPQNQTPATTELAASNTVSDSDSGSDSEDNDGFVRVDHWGSSLDPPLVSFKPTIAHSSSQSSLSRPSTLSASSSIAKPSRLMEKVRSSLKAAVASSASASSSPSSSVSSYGFQTGLSKDGATRSQSDPAFGVDDSLVTGRSKSSSDSDSDNADSCSDEEISNVLDETEIQLIEAMEDAQISDAKHKRPVDALHHSASTVAVPVTSTSTTATPTATLSTSGAATAASVSPMNVAHSTPIVGSPRKSLMLTGLSEGRCASPMGYVDSLKERFSTSNMRSTTISNGATSTPFTYTPPATVDDKVNDGDGVMAVSAQTDSTRSSSTAEASISRGGASSTTEADREAEDRRISTRTNGSNSDNTNTTPATPSSIVKMAEATQKTSCNVLSDTRTTTKRQKDRVIARDGPGTLDSSGANRNRPTSVPLESVEFVAPGVTKQTAMSLLRRVLDIDGPVIQQKMVEFLLIDGVIASLTGFITHCRGSVYSPAPVDAAQTAPCSPSISYHESKSGHPTGHNTPPAAEGVERPAAKTAEGHTHSQSFHEHDASATAPSSLNSGDKDIPIGVLHEFDLRNRHRERLQRQRSRCTGLSEDDLRRAYNATQMLCSRDQHARKVLEAKLSVIVPSLMAVFNKDSLGSFHHVCLLLEHCFVVSPLKTTRLLLYQQNPPSRWWSSSEAVANGYAPICDIIPYLSEPCVQRLFLKAEFGVWTGRLMVSLNLSPNDAVVVSDELNRMGLGSVASALGPSNDSTSGQAQSQQRSKSMQLVRNRFQQLNRGGFLSKVLELVEDQDELISESVAEFVSHLINDFSAFYGFNLLFKPMYDSELPVRRLAQMIVNSPSQRLSPQARSATRVLHALLTKTSCQYGLRTREAQGIRDPTMHPRGSHVLLHVGQAARNALGSFLPGLLATVTGQHKNSDLTSHSAYNRRVSVESLQLPEYEESDLDLDTEDTEAESSDSNSDSEGCSDRLLLCGTEDAQHPQSDGCASQKVDGSRKHAGNGSDSDSDSDRANSSNDVADLRSSAAALLHATYSGSIGSGSISSSLSPSSTLSASPLAIASSTPDDVYIREGMDSEDMGLLLSLPKPDIDRLNLLKVCIEVLRESDEIDEIAGWIDLRIWRALGTWFLNHPHNNMLHLAVYQLVSIVTLEAVRLRKLHRRLYAGMHSKPLQVEPLKMYSASRYPWRSYPYPGQHNNSGSFTKTAKHNNSDSFTKTANMASGGGASASTSDVSNYLSAHTHPLDDTTSSGSDSRETEYQAQQVAQRKVYKRRAIAERIRYEETTNCDNILTYMVEQYQWADKLIRRTLSPNFDGAHGYISLILNTLRLAIQVDRKRYPGDFSGESSGYKSSKSEKHDVRSSKYKGAGPVPDGMQQHKLSVHASIDAIMELDAAKAYSLDETNQGTLTDDGVITDALSEFSDDEGMSHDNDLLPDLPYHDPATRERLGEYPLYRLQRWEISLLYSPSFQTHLRRLRSRASTMVNEINEFRLCDQSRTEIISSKNENGGKRPVPFFSPQRVKAPVLFDNVELKKKQMQISVGLLFGNSTKRNSNSPAPSSGPSDFNDRKKSEGSSFDNGGLVDHHCIDEFGVDINSLFARMLGFTNDLVELPARSNSVSGAGQKGYILDQATMGEEYKNVGIDSKGDKCNMSGSKKTHVSGNSKPSSLRRKKSKPNSGLPLASTPSVSKLFEDMSPEAAADAAEAICSALANENANAGAATATAAIVKHSQGAVRGRKKPTPVSGSVRRRRARLHNKVSNPNLNSQTCLSTQQAFSASKLAHPLSNQNGCDLDGDDASEEAMDANDDDPCEELSTDSPMSAIGLTSSMQSLDLVEQ